MMSDHLFAPAQQGPRQQYICQHASMVGPALLGVRPGTRSGEAYNTIQSSISCEVHSY